jgi:exopolysaccharide biosynthesis polyprenyl glycosylphosphotransferase
MLREAHADVDVRVEPQAKAAPKLRRWPESTPPPISRRPLSAVCAEIRLKPLSRAHRLTKRSFDIVLSSLGLLTLAPLFAVIAGLVRLTSKGPALFMQERCGLGGRVFRFYKFRTMVDDAERRKCELQHLNEMSGPVFKIRKDPRITRLGHVLRKTSLDELPQLWNVLKGDMSLVGPRPPLPEEVERYDEKQAQRLSVPPGITGLWQVSGRNTLVDFNTWIELDLDYARRTSLWLDAKILLKTVVVVVLARGAQ